MSNGSAILMPDVRLSADQREQQRQQMIHDMGVLARNLNLVRDGMKNLMLMVESLEQRVVLLETAQETHERIDD